MKALHSRIRKNISKVLHKIFSTLFPVNLNPEPIKADTIQKILVVRINYRIGNILFTTPLLNALEKQFPHAQIDMMVGAPFTKTLIEGMPQIDTVYAFPRKLLKQPLKVLSLKKELKNNGYDLLVTPNLHSTSDTLFTFLVSATYKVGFYAKDVFSPLTHAIAPTAEVKHEALKPLVLMSAFSDAPLHSYAPYLDIRLTDKEKTKAGAEIAPNTIGIFRDARGDKKLDNTWWQALLDALNTLAPTLHIVDILDPNNTTPLNNTIQTLSEKNLRTLAAKIANLDAFICADTGPMHLASSSKTPTIALFKTTSPVYYGTLGAKDLSLVLHDKKSQEIAKEILTHLGIITA